MSTLSPFQPPVDRIDLGDGRRVRLVELLGKGACSSVYRGALESRSGVQRAVAVKLFGAVASEEAPQVFELLARTARRWACIRHPNVVATFDCGRWHATPFVVTELVDGVTLQTVLERGRERRQRLALDLALFIAVEVAEALSGARTARGADGVQLGVLHLGLTAREVLLSFRGEVKVTDFEVSTTRAASSSVRSLRAVAGRATMMAPEIAQGGSGDARSDVFSLGVLLRELLVGPRFPTTLSNAEAIRLARDGYVQPICFQPHLPEALVRTMTRALEIDPMDRFPNATAMLYELRRVALGMGVGDARYFLRRALEREWGQDASETTLERQPCAAPPTERDPSPEERDTRDRRP